uniref:Uncharacterized protein n=1 Tax=Phlebotomus papatasi TaxID=29031 RepID=A0A1B0DR31_PHLPP
MVQHCVVSTQAEAEEVELPHLMILVTLVDSPTHWEIRDDNQSKWYKKVYNTIHKAKDDDEYVTVRYKTRRGRYPYKANGYMSEPEPNYDSDYSFKYSTLDRRRTPSAGSQYDDSRTYGTMPNPIRSGHTSYRNQPGRIENYIPGRSSVSERETRE